VGIVLVALGILGLLGGMERMGPSGQIEGVGGLDLAPALVIACGVGLWDDLRGLRPLVKLALFLVAALIAAHDDRVLVVRELPFAGDLAVGRLGWLLTLFWLACYPQAFNFMDGLNGIAGLSALVSLVTFAVAGREQTTTIAAVAAAAVLGFLPWNFPKARIFLGDAGSLPLGLLLAWLAVRANATGTLSFPASILLLGPFIFDVAFTLFRRWREGKTIGEAHKEHLYQRLSRVWGSHAKVSLLYAGFSVVTGILALAYGSMSDLGKLLSLVLPLAAMLGFAAFVLRAEREKGR
jgi:UDP-N-acetylmuramyl pentapeptide phosphotransferase/UDP-N-acetylglucosamine-1-phosphate transferase